MRKFIKMHILFYESASTLSIDLNTLRIENWFYTEAVSTNYKTADRCELVFEDTDGEKYHYKGYVPDFFPDKHFGDYIMLRISAEGFVQDFACTDVQIATLLEESY